MRFAGITHGRMESDERLPMARVVRTFHPAGTVLETHAHEGACFTLVLTGSLVEEAGGRAFRSVPGTLLFRPAFEPHGNRYGRDGCCSVLIELALAGRDAPGIRLPHAIRHVVAPAAVRLARDISRHAGHGAVSATEADNGVLELASIAFDEASRVLPRRSPESSCWLTRVYQRISDAPFDLPSVAALAEAECVHVDHLIRTFREVYGETPGLFARRLRARAAAREIIAGARSLAGIAARSGYADQSHMTRELRRFLSTTPGEVRRSTEHARLA